MKDRNQFMIGEWGPLTVERTASGPKIGWVITIRDGSGERVEVRTTPKGKGMTVRQTLWPDWTVEE